mgnify:CR=1 FL=1
MAYIQKNSPLNQDAKFMIKQYDKTRQNMSASGEKAFKKGQSEAAITAASFVPIGKVVGGVVKLAKGITNLSKVSKTVKATTKTPKVDIPKELPHYGDMRGPNMGKYTADFSKGGPVSKVLDITKSKGKIYDKLPSNFEWKPSMFKRMPSVADRKMVDVNPGKGIPSQRFYESSGGGMKKFKDGTSSKGHWTPLEGFGRSSNSKTWFIKSPGAKEGWKKGWDKGYGSNAFKDMGKNINKMGY